MPGENPADSQMKQRPSCCPEGQRLFLGLGLALKAIPEKPTPLPGKRSLAFTDILFLRMIQRYNLL